MELLAYWPAAAIVGSVGWTVHRLKGDRTWWEALLELIPRPQGGGGPGLPK